MSRCFPFPPPTCRGEDVSPIGSIKKLQNESRNAKHSNERNTDRKEKKNKKSSRRQHGKLGNAEHKKRKLRHNQVTEFVDSFPEPKKVASGQFERSCLTEEHELPASIPNPCNSLESTQSSNKRKAQGLVVHMKLPLMKHKELKAVNMDPSCSHEAASISKLRRSSVGGASELKVTMQVKQQRTSPANEEPCISGRFTEAPAVQRFAATDMVFGSRSGSRTPKMDKYFRSLLLNWNPPSLQSDDIIAGAQDWLFGVNPSSSDIGGAKKLKGSSMPNHRICAASASSMQPRACYLPECEIYQLPYVIPF